MAELTGKELGIAVAKEVMGWTRTDTYPMFSCSRIADTIVVTDSVHSGTRYWAPWRDMNDAWEVVELFLSRGYEVVVSGGFSMNLSACMIYKGFAASYPPRDTFLHLWSIDSPLTEELRIPSYREQAPTICEAILQAALAAVRDKKEATC